MKPFTSDLGQFLVDLLNKRVAFNLRLGNWDKLTVTFTRDQLRKVCKVSRIEDATIERMFTIIEDAGFDTYVKGNNYVVTFDPRESFNSAQSLSDLIAGNAVVDQIELALAQSIWQPEVYTVENVGEVSVAVVA